MIDDHSIGGDESDGEEPDTDPVLEACSLLIQHGSIERTEREMFKKLPLTKAEINDAVAEAVFKVTASAPRELRPSFETVVSWHRWNYLYGKMMKANKPVEAMAAQKAIDNLMARVH